MDKAEKPPIGEGLNKPAEVVLLGVYKIDKATGARVTDAAAIDSFVRRLKRLAANQAARFLDYDSSGGVWRFQVEHFSKCVRSYNRAGCPSCMDACLLRIGISGRPCMVQDLLIPY